MKKMMLMVAVLAATGAATFAGAQALNGQRMASVYFLDKVGYGAVSVWIDGTKVIDSNFVPRLGVC